MTPEELFEAIGQVDEARLAESEQWGKNGKKIDNIRSEAPENQRREKKKFHPGRWGSLAAGICLVLLSVWMIRSGVFQGNSGAFYSSMSEESDTMSSEQSSAQEESSVSEEDMADSAEDSSSEISTAEAYDQASGEEEDNTAGSDETANGDHSISDAEEDSDSATENSSAAGSDETVNEENSASSSEEASEDSVNSAGMTSEEEQQAMSEELAEEMEEAQSISVTPADQVPEDQLSAQEEEIREKGKGMQSTYITQIIILIILLLLSAFFSSAETALTTVNRIQVQLKAEEGKAAAVRVLWILDRSDKMLSAILIGNNVVNLSASALTTTLTISMFGNVFVGVATGILTLLLLLFGEIIPKSLARVYALRISLSYSMIIKPLMILLTPVILLVDGILFCVLKLMHINKDEVKNPMTEEELKSLVDVGLEEGAIEDDEFEMISNVFRLDESLARDIMTPRVDITYVQADMNLRELNELFDEYHHSRYPVYVDNRDTVIGILNVKDLLLMSEQEKQNFSVRTYLREPHFTFEHKEVGTLLIEMREESLAMTMVLDEYGTVTGMITMEDILEEIVGEIRDEYDHDEKDAVRPLSRSGEYLIDGSTNLDEVNEALGTELESEEYDSIGGYIIEYLDRLPKKGEKIVLPDGMQLIVTMVRRNRIETVHLILPEKRED